jgi:hypothetical protein
VFLLCWLIGFLDIKGALIDVSNMVAMLHLFERLKKFTPVLFVGMLIFSFFLFYRFILSFYFLLLFSFVLSCTLYSSLLIV